MGEFLVRKCDAVDEGTAGDEGMLPVVLCSAPTSAGSKRRRIPHEAEKEDANSAQICDKRKKMTAWSSSSPSSSTVHVAPGGCAVSSRCANRGNCSSSAAGEEEEESAPREKHVQGSATVCADEQGEERLRLCRRLRLAMKASGEHSGESGGIVDSSSAPSSASSSTGLEEEDKLPAEELGELESTAANTAQGSSSGRSAPSAAARTTPPVRAAAAAPEHEIEAFFAKAEEDLASKFADKYNYDIVKDTPLEGRYDWVRIKP